jgi:hypothetical protein
MGLPGVRQGGDEADDCTCARCRGVELQEWLGRADEDTREPRDARGG